jgi:hypothetical protein
MGMSWVPGIAVRLEVHTLAYPSPSAREMALSQASSLAAGVPYMNASVLQSIS